MFKAKYFITVGIVILIALAWNALNDRPSKFTIRVISGNSPDSKLEFSGRYTITNTEGETITNIVDSTTPATYLGDGEIISCSFKKKCADGNLKVILFNFNNDELKEENTNSAYGMVNMSFK